MVRHLDDARGNDRPSLLHTRSVRLLVVEQDTESTNASQAGADAPQGRRRLAERQFLMTPGTTPHHLPA